MNESRELDNFHGRKTTACSDVQALSFDKDQYELARVGKKQVLKVQSTNQNRVFVLMPKGL